IEDAQAGLEQAKIERDEVIARQDTMETITLPNAVAALEQADQEAQDELATLNGKLNTTQQDLGTIRTDLTEARDTAEAAAEDAASARSEAEDANANALAAIGVAADKGRIFYQSAEPTGDDRSPNNLWIDSDDGRVYVWNGSAWEESQSEDLRDAAQAAVAAQQAAEAADSKAQAAAAAAAAADAKADAAQQTAADATLDAREAHNAAVAAAARAEEIRQDLATGPSLWADPSFERSRGGLPGPGADDLYPGRIDRSQDWADRGVVREVHR